MLISIPPIHDVMPRKDECAKHDFLLSNGTAVAYVEGTASVLDSMLFFNIDLFVRASSPLAMNTRASTFDFLSKPSDEVWRLGK